MRSREERGTGGRRTGLFIGGVIILLLIVAGSSAFAEDSSQSPQSAATFIPGWATPEELKAASEAGNTASLAGPATDPDSAEELPHEDLGRAEAVELLTSVFGEMIDAPASPLDGVEIEEFHSDRVAVIASDDPQAEPGLLTSELPLRATTGSGEKAPIELDLESAGGELRPENPLAEIEIPAKLGEGITLSDTGVSIKVPAAPTERSPSNLEDSAAFYPNVAEDSDLVVMPTHTGAETSTVLRSPDAPPSQTYDLTLPPGAHLKASPGGGATVVKDEETLVSVLPPTAIDAEGDSVDVTMEVSDSALVVTAAPGARDKFPILVDPIFETYFWSQFPNDHSAEWHLQATAYPFVAGWYSYAGGLGLYAYPGPIAAPPYQAMANYYVPRFFSDFNDLAIGKRPTSYIKEIKLWDLSFIISEYQPYADHPYLQMGLWSEDKADWVSLGVRRGIEGQLTDPNQVYPLSNPGEYTDAKNGGISLASFESQSHPRTARVGMATVEISDQDDPQVGLLNSGSGWVNDKVSTPINYLVNDPGLGIYGVQVRLPSAAGGSSEVKASANCDGSARIPCPQGLTSETRPLPYTPASMPQGENWLQFSATDPVGHRSAIEKSRVKVDHSQPSLSLSGTLTEQATVGTKLPQYTLKLNASDGDVANAEALSAIGSPGTAAGQLERPQGVAVDGAGNVYVSDRINQRIVQYDKDGGFVRQIGTPGSGNGQINEPRGVALTPAGDIWVAEIGNKRLQEFNSKGEFVRTITLDLGNQARFAEPWGIAVGPSGTLWVADVAADKVFRFNESGSYLGAASGFGLSPGLNAPTGVAVDSFGNAWVASSGNHKVFEFNPEGKYVLQFGAEGTGNGQFRFPTGVALTGSGNVMVADDLNNRIQVFETDGSYLRRFGSGGVADGELKEPRGIAVGPGNTALIADAGNKRIARWAHADLDPQSGIKKIQVKIDGKLEWEKGLECSAGPCTIPDLLLNAEFYAVGQHELEVIATDGVQLLSTKKLTFESYVPPSIALSGSMTEQASLGTTRPRYKLKLNASAETGTEDPQTYSAPAYATAFGGSGTAAGQFAHPGDVAIDPKGNLWVADMNNNRIQKFGPKGEFLMQFGSYGNADGQFRRPAGVAIDPKGNVWVADANNNRIQKFTETGQFLAKIGSYGSANNQFKGPEGVDVDAKGNVWVADTANGRIQVLDENAAYLKTVSSQGTGTGQLGEPSRVDVGPGGKVWVTDWQNSRVVAFSEAGQFLLQFGSYGSADGQFKHADGLAVDGLGNVWVSDEYNHRVQRFNEDGEYLTQFGLKGTGDGQFAFRSPVGIAPDSRGGLWVTDADNNRVQKWKWPLYSSKVTTQISVDGKVVDTGEANCIGDQCPVFREWTLEASQYAAGNHSVVAKVTDGQGIARTKSLTITTAPDTTAPQLTANGALVQAPQGWVEQKTYGVSTSATDANGYGVKQIALKIDGQIVSATAEFPCDAGGCPRLKTFSVDTAEYEGGAHHAEIIATDWAGNTAKKAWTMNVDPSGQIPLSEAESTLEAVSETSEVDSLGEAASEPTVDGSAPGLELEMDEGEITSVGAAAPSVVGDEPGATVTVGAIGEVALLPPCEGEEEKPSPPEEVEATHLSGSQEEALVEFAPEGCTPVERPTDETLVPIEITPVTVGIQAMETEIAQGDAAAVSTNVLPNVDMIVRPLYDGAQSFASIRDSSAPDTFSWEVSLEDDQELRLVDQQHAVVEYSDVHVVGFTITARPAHDAIGTSVPTSLSVSEGNVLTLTVHHKQQAYVYPVNGGVGWQGGFETYIIEMPPPEGSPQEPEEGGAAIEEGGVKIAAWGPPKVEPAGSNLWNVQPLSKDPKVRNFRFTYCKPHKIPDNPFPPGEPGPPWNRPISPSVSDCHNPELEGIFWAVSVHGKFHYKLHEWVLLRNDEFDCKRWGPEAEYFAEMNCHREASGVVSGPIKPIGHWRFKPGKGQFGTGSTYATCWSTWGEIKPVIPPGDGPLTAPVFVRRTGVQYVVDCDWPF